MTSEQPSGNFNGLDVELIRAIDAVCRRFEADWRAGERPLIDDYLADVPEQIRSALRGELEALDHELRPSDETGVRSGAVQSSSIAEAPTIAPGSLPTSPVAGLAVQPIHEEATLPPRDEDAINLGRTEPAQAEAGSPSRVRYFGDYEIVRELARGGMGVVFQARQVSLNRPVALKMILAGQLADDDAVRRFHIEAEAAANLDHPGIVPIYEVGEYEGQHYFSMGFVEGQSLSQKIANGPLPPRLAAELMVKVSEAIEYAHHHGVIHRDLKPANILLDQAGNPRVTDFGLAKKLEGDSGLTGSGQIMGTPSYMPPEQAGGPRGEVGPLADVYALGATLYALVTGRPPFQASTAMDTVLQVMSDDPVPPRRLNASVPLDVETICLKCLEKEQGKRYGSASALGEDLRRYLAGEPIRARPVTRSERVVKWARRRPAIAALMGLVILVTALGLGGVIWQWREAVGARDLAEHRRVDADHRRREAEEAREKEEAQTKLAEERMRDALEAKAKEREQTQLAEQRLYDVRMNLIQRNWEDYNGALMLRGLDEEVPASSDAADRRGFEWFYWRRKIASGHITLAGNNGFGGIARFTRDGKRIVAGSIGGVKLWDAVTGQEIRVIEPQARSYTFSPDGSRFAIVGLPGTLKVGDTKTGLETVTLKGASRLFGSEAVFNPDGHRLAVSITEIGPIKVWDTRTGLETVTLTKSTGIVSNMAYSPDGHLIAANSAEANAGERTVKVWDAMTGQETPTLKGHGGYIYRVVFSPDGKRLASASVDRTVKLWDTATGQGIHTLNGHTRDVNSVAFSPDGRTLASASWDRTVKLWDTASGRPIRAIEGSPSRLEFRQEGKLFGFVTGSELLQVWDTATGQATVNLKGNTNGVMSVSPSVDGRWIATVSMDATVKVWDATTGQVAFTLILKDQVLKVPSGSPETRTIMLSGVAFSPDGHRIASAGSFGTVTFWDADTRREIRTVRAHTGLIYGLAYSPDGRRLVTGNDDGTVNVWDTMTGLETLTLKGHHGNVTSVAFNSEGSVLATGSDDGTVKIWDARPLNSEPAKSGPSLH